MENFAVAFCGLYCGACGKFKKGKCPGCTANAKAAWCEVRKCCLENNYLSCADCAIMPLGDCKKFNNVFAKIIGLVTWTDRGKCISRIREIGPEAFAAEMGAAKKMSIKK